MRFLNLRRVRASVACLVLLLSVAPAIARQDENLPPDVFGKKHVRPMVPWAIGVGFMVACLLVGVKNPRRSHLD